MTITLSLWDKAPFVFFDENPPEEVRETIDKDLSYEVDGFRWSDSYKDGSWDGRHHLLREASNGNLYFPVGVLDRVTRVLDMYEIDYEVENLVRPGRGDLDVSWETDMKLRDYQEYAVNEALRAGSGVLVMPTGCHAPGAELLGYDGELVPVEDVEEGDRLMGPDSDPRTVIDTADGESEMYRVEPVKGDPFVVTHDHKLTLVRTNDGSEKAGELVDVPVTEWTDSSDWFKHVHKLVRTPVDFGESELPVRPHFLGVVLGDGSLTGGTPQVHSDEPAVVEAINSHAESHGLMVKSNETDERTTCHTLSTGRSKYVENPLTDFLRDHVLDVPSPEKHIPHSYKTASESDRLELLAGLIDTDGHLDNGGFEYSSASEDMARDVAYVARSVGLAAYVSEKEAVNQNGHAGTYYRVYISGDTDRIPTRVPRKQAPKRRQKKDVLRTGFDVEPVGRGVYFGVTVDRDNRYVMGDFTVTHNSGKTLVGLRLMYELKRPVVVFVHRKEIADQWSERISDILDVEPARYYGGDHETGDVMVALYQSVYDNEEGSVSSDVELDHDVFIPDEIHRIGADTYSNVALSITAPYRFGLTATFTREDNAELRVVGGAGRKIVDMSVEKLIDDGWLAEPEWHILDAPHSGGRYRQWQDEYAGEIVENEGRNQLIAEAVETSPKPALVTVERINHGERLESLIPEAAFIHGDHPDRSEVVQSFRDGELPVLIATRGIVGEGFDVPEVRTFCVAGGLKSSTSVLQQVGRALRPGESGRAAIVDFADRGEYVGDHSEQRFRTYQRYYKKHGP